MKSFPLYICFCFFTVSLLSQNKKFEVSPVIGVEFPFAIGNNDDNLEFDYSLRPSVGASFKISFSDKFGLQPEISLQLRELKIINKTASGASQRYSSTYFVIPAYINYRITDNFSLLMGPRLGVDLTFSASYNTGTNGTYSSSTGESLELSGVFGFQYITPIKFFISVKGLFAFTSQDYTGEVNDGALLIGAGRFF